MIRLIFFVILFIEMNNGLAQTKKPFRIGIAGLTHTHVHGLLSRARDGDIEIVGIAESNRELAERYLSQYHLPMTLLFPSLDEMLEKCKPEAVTAFNATNEHLEVMKKCAPRKIHVMVEKPLAVSLDHARQMESLAKKYGIHLLTNYETTWYGSVYALRDMFSNSKLGKIRKVVAHDGHQGPKEIGVNNEFLNWLTDPVKNGGGALTDFGCYGANLLTWLMQGERPTAVMAVTQQIKPDIYPLVDDEATIIVIYKKTQGIIQASWNWPFNRKDIEVYGETGYAIADRNGLTFKTSAEPTEQTKSISPLARPNGDPFAYLASVVRGETSVNAYDLSSLQNNMIVIEILDAAKESARLEKVIHLKQ